MTELGNRVRAIMSATFGLPIAQITDATGSDNLESWDSINHLQLIVALEAEFDVTFDTQQAIELTSVRKIEDALRALGRDRP
jgi:acyl carrier protein